MVVKGTPFAIVCTPVVWFQRMAWASAVLCRSVEITQVLMLDSVSNYRIPSM